MVDCQRVQPSSKTSIGGQNVTRVASMEGGKKNKFWFTEEPALMPQLTSHLTVLKRIIRFGGYTLQGISPF
jgi:hypothetical protein